MGMNETSIEEAGLHFFGKLSAAVSHDLKNVLSIINEKAGLLEDFCQMAQRGRTLDVPRIDAITAQVKAQVERADQIIRSFNRFSHSVDHPIAPTEMGETVLTLVHLTQRLLAGMQVTATVQPADPVVIATRPLMAQRLIWAGLQWAAAHPAEGRRIGLEVSARAEGAVVRIAPLADTTGVTAGLRESTRELLEALKAKIEVDTAGAALQIYFAPLAMP